MTYTTTRLFSWLLPVVFMLFLNTPAVQAQLQTSSSFEFTATPMLTAERDIQPVEYKTVRIDFSSLESTLSQAPLRATGRLDGAPEITLPLPDGTFQRFNVVEAPIMQEGLSASFPDIKTFRVAGIDDPGAYGRFSITPNGFNAMILRRGASTIYIDSFNAQQPDYAMVYDRDQFVETFQRRVGVEQHEPEVTDPALEQQSIDALMNEDLQFSGTVHRSYRLAMATTAEYTSFHSQPSRCSTPEDPVACAMAAIVVAMNRVNGLYERDIAVTMNLIDNNDILISQNPGDYSNNSGFAMLNQNQARIDNLIGSANYDIGHVFSTGGGGVAQLSSVCNNSGKARGVTGLPQPIGDPFYVDFVSHEIGHQFGATHTFNASSGNCSGGNYTGQSAFEPGSGSTIMAYAGICAPQNIQFASDDYFHIGSLNQMVNFINNANTGGSCSVDTPTDNNPPVVDGGLTGLTLPVSTPFTLEGTATDPDGDELVFNWEQYDLGPQGPPNQPTGNAPLFRSFPSVDEPVRTFPRWNDILGGTQTLGEILPDYTRNMRFRLTARDNVPINGGVGFDEVQFSVTANAGPFLVPGPGNGTQWLSGNEVLVAWDVANTNVAPVSAETVTIYLSTNAGNDFDVVLAESLPNSGFALVELPAGVTTSQARVKVKAEEHVFFNVSPANFSISNDVEVPLVSIQEGPIDLEVSTEEPTAGSFSISVENSITYNYGVVADNSDLPDGVMEMPADRISFTSSSGSMQGNSSREIEFLVDADGLDEDLYAARLTLVSDSGVDPVSIIVLMDIRTPALNSQIITSIEGWRISAAPVTQETVSGVFQNFTTQGFEGADNDSEELNPSVYYMSVTGLRAVPDAEFAIEGGEAVLSYLFADDLPANIRAFGFSNRSPFEMELSNQLVIGQGEAAGNSQSGWNLKGNPFAQNINLANLSSDDMVNTSRTFQVWNPRINNGNGGYLAWPGYDVYPDNVPNNQAFRGQIQPFQGFWARALSNNASITLDEDILTDNEFTPDPEERLMAAYYTLELTAGDFTTYNVVMFSDAGTLGIDAYDSDQLTALSNDYAYFYSVSSNPTRARVVESRSLNQDATSVAIPMNVEATFDGEFTITLSQLTGPVDNFGSLEFTDQLTGETVSLGLGDSYTFSYEAPENGEELSEDPVKAFTNLPGFILDSETSPRFLATFNLDTPVNIDNEELDVPQQVQLRQNYPNPFNPTTNITFGLPQAADVTLEVYNVAGQRVATLVNNSRMNSGFHTITFDASRLASGVYLYRLTAAGQVRTEKMTLIK
ncbi:MAG: M12 family metallo-peptidase [Balneolia bacterium]|nr:M12 family metallo-peptidase [Balneolia bacterium]